MSRRDLKHPKSLPQGTFLLCSSNVHASSWMQYAPLRENYISDGLKVLLGRYECLCSSISSGWLRIDAISVSQLFLKPLPRSPNMFISARSSANISPVRKTGGSVLEYMCSGCTVLRPLTISCFPWYPIHVFLHIVPLTYSPDIALRPS